MSDLESRLRGLVDSSPVMTSDLGEVIARGRHLRRRRLAAATGSAAVVAVTIATAMTVMAPMRQDPSVVLTSPPSPLPMTDGTREAVEREEQERLARESMAEREAAARRAAISRGGNVRIDDIPLPLGIIDDQGLHPNDLADVPPIDGRVTTAFADGEGGVVYQLADEPGTIHWRRAEGRNDRYAVETGSAVLLGVVLWEGTPYVVFGHAVPDDETPTQAVSIFRGGDQAVQTLSTGLTVENIEGVGLTDDGRLVLSNCHVRCRLYTLDLVQNLRTAQPVPAEGPFGEPRLTWGFGGSTGRLFTLSSEQPTRMDGLLLDEVAPDGEVLTSHDVPLGRTVEAADLRIGPDNSAALIELIRAGEPVEWLLVDLMDTPWPRVRRITGATGRVVLLGHSSSAK